MFTEKLSGQQEEKIMFDVAWEKSQHNQVIEGLKAGRPISEIISEMPGFLESFSRSLDTLDCSDGRVVSGRKFGLAGEGILLSPEDRQVLVAALKEKGIKITGHDNCGAAGIAHPDDPESDRYGYENARKLAAETGSEYKEVHKEDFRSPFHDERVLVVDESGRFDCANWPEFPAQFISSAPFFGLSDNYLKTEIAALANIALGDHGFGQRFSETNPFYVVVSATTPEKLNHFKALASEAASVFGSRVKVDGFLAPDKSKQ